MTQIHIFNEQSALPIDLEQIPPLIHQILHEEGEKANELSLYFVEMKVICLLHDKYFSDPSPTDCISFPMDGPMDPYRILGEIFICPEAACHYAKSHPKTTAYQELTLYIVHGMLHLFGYDDINQIDRKKMRGAEKRQMQKLKELGLILSGGNFV